MAQKMIFEQSVFLKGPCQFFEGENDYMWIDTAKKHIVTTASVSISPRKTVASPVDYTEQDGGVIRVRLAGSTSWITHQCCKEAAGIWWTILEKDYFWEYVPDHEVPDWAHATFAKGIVKLEGTQP